MGILLNLSPLRGPGPSMSVNKPIFIARCRFIPTADGVDTTQSCIFCGFCLSMLMYRVRERETEWEIYLSLADVRPVCRRPCPKGRNQG